MSEPLLLNVSLLVIFFLIPIVQMVINPASISQTPTAPNSMNVVAQTAAQSIAIFAVVLVIIQFILDSGSIQGFKLLSISVLALSTCFLILTFTMELFADIKVVVFHLQLTSLRYSGLLLFLGLGFLLRSHAIPSYIPQIFDVFVTIAWIAWVLHEIHYLTITQTHEWACENMSRTEWIKENLISRLQ